MRNPATLQPYNLVTLYVTLQPCNLVTLYVTLQPYTSILIRLSEGK